MGVLIATARRATVPSEVMLEVAEAGAALPANGVCWMNAPVVRIIAAHGESLESLTDRVDADFDAARCSGAHVVLVWVALGSPKPTWGWSGRRALIEALVRRAADQLIERYEVVVSVTALPHHETEARAFDLLDRLMHVVDSRGTLRMRFELGGAAPVLHRGEP